ncbi:hypothetical protein, partial [Allosphingosinicella sp.]|uniref:tetratricopeptide repeat protein n=1 Tax=Allosphingosinicella sp. TaxID=2823234 RepID=UPI002EE8E811
MPAAAGAAAAQESRFPAGATVQPLPTPDSGAELRRHLTELAANPRNVSALIGAGRAALEVGDGQAALGFFARADEFAPRDARVKAGMASAFVQLEQPQAALRFFAEAAQLGAPEVEIAADRGLAFDMVGNPRRAQQDYAMLLQRGGAGQDEVRRRLALSLAISGNRAAALAALDPLLRRQDRASYRTRAFVLALTGDSSGAAQAVESSLPGQSSAMAPFLSRLAGLSPAQKAMAVHFGRFPADGRPIQMAEAVDTSAHPAAVALTGVRPSATTPAPRRGTAEPMRRRSAAAPVRTEPRRRPGTDDVAPPPRIGLAARYPTREEPAAARPQPARTQPAQVAPPPREEPPVSRPEPALARQIVTAEAQPGFTLPPSGPPPAEPAADPPAPVETAVAQPSPEFAD